MSECRDGRVPLFAVFITGLFLALSVLPLSVSQADVSQEEDVAFFRKQFAILAGGGPLDNVLDRSQWPKNDLLSSYLELELLIHPRVGVKFPVLRSFLQRWPQHPQRRRLEKLMENQMVRYDDAKEALAWFDSHPPSSQSGRLRYLDLLLDQKRTPQAELIWRGLYTAGVEFSGKIRKRLGSFNTRIRPQDREARIRQQIATGNRTGLETLIGTLPKERQEYFLALDAAHSAQDSFNTHLSRLKGASKRSPELWKERMDALRKGNSLDKAREMLLGKEGSYLSVGERQRMRYLVGRVYFSRGKLSEAFELLDLNVAEKGAKLEDSLWLAAWSAYRLGHLSQARTRFILLAREASSGHRRAQGAWWAYRTVTEDQERWRWLDWATRYPDSFYGLMALETRDKRLPSFEDPPLACDFIKQDAFRADVEKLAWLQDVGRNYYNGPEIEDLARRRQLGLEESLCLSLEYGAYDHAVKVASKLRAQGKTYWRGLYPLPDWTPEGGWRVDPALVWGTVRQESMFFHRVESSAQAMGLLQLIPPTAKQEAKASNLPESNRYRLQLPSYNLALGQGYLIRMLQRFKGDLALALVGYNAGPGRGDKWLPDRKREDTLEFIENIPFTETRHYVKHVTKGVAIYQMRLYGKGSVLGLIDQGQPGEQALIF